MTDYHFLKMKIISKSLDVVFKSQIDRYLPNDNIIGIIFTLHKISPGSSALKFDPNSHLAITPDFLESVVKQVLADGYKPIFLSELPKHFKERRSKEKLVAFTLDDGYRNNLKYAVPIFEKYQVPCTIFLTSGFVTRTKSMWWETAADLVMNNDTLQFDFGEGSTRHKLYSQRQKATFYHKIVRFISSVPEEDAVRKLDKFAYSECGLDPLMLVDDQVMNTNEIGKLAAGDLVQFGAHSVSHLNLTRVSQGRLESEITRSIEAVRSWVGYRPSSFAYPYGGRSAVGKREVQAIRDAGLDLAVTTMPNVLRERHSRQIGSLPRVSLNGHFQKIQYVRSMMTGLPFIFSR